LDTDRDRAVEVLIGGATTGHYAKGSVELCASPSVTGVPHREDGKAVEFDNKRWQAELQQVPISTRVLHWQEADFRLPIGAQ
jgi:hypothetical protein